MKAVRSLALGLSLLLLLTLVSESSARANPRLILIFRHGEESDESGVHLSSRGIQRAKELPKLVRKEIKTMKLGAVYAQGAKSLMSSRRSIETATPVAEAFKLKVNDTFEKGKAKKMVKDLLTRTPELDGKAVVIVWGHEELPDIPVALGYVPPAGKKLDWSRKLFDHYWRIELNPKGQIETFTEEAQQLLPGDSAPTEDD